MKSALLLTACAALLAAPVWAQQKAHLHGFVTLNIAVQGGQLTVQLEAPLDSLLGFEHRPRTDAQRKAAESALAVINKPQDWLRPDAAAQCKLVRTDVQADALQPAAKPAAKADAKTDEHTDLEAAVDFTCAEPGQLKALDLGLFDAFPRINRIDVQVAGAGGQLKQTLRRPARAVRLVR